MRLLVDYGNTRLKWALDGSHGIEPGAAFAHAGHAGEAALAGLWSTLPRPQSIHVASVVDAAREAALRSALVARFDREVEFVRSPPAALGIVNAYREPARLGVDRFLALAAVHAEAARAQVLVGCGTALTLDALDASGHHLGGLILPSPTLMRRALGVATARVGEAGGRLVEIAGDTADAAWSGPALAAVAVVERFRAEVARRLGSAVALVGDGGGLDEWRHLLPDLERAHDLVLRGLALWAGSCATAAEPPPPGPAPPPRG